MSDYIVLLVDNQQSSRETALERLRDHSEGATVVPEGSIDAAKETLQNREVDCVVTEYELSDATGLDLAAHVRKMQPDVGCILYTATDHSEIDTEETGGAIADFVDRDAPNAVEELWRVVEFTAEFRTQSAYPLPQNETERLEALDAYELDPETVHPDIQLLTDLAANHFDAPMASVNLIKEHSQEFLACHGMDWTPTSREDSICTYTILEEREVLLIDDVKDDPRFEDKENLEEMNIRSYAGANLTTDEGLSIGTLCVYDEKPRTFTDDDREFLSTLADVTMNVIDLRYEISTLKSGLGATESGGDES